MSQANDKAIDRLSAIASNIKGLDELAGAPLDQIEIEFKPKDLAVSMTASNQDAYRKTFAITGDSRGIPQEDLDEISSEENRSDLIIERLNHIIMKRLKK